MGRRPKSLCLSLLPLLFLCAAEPAESWDAAGRWFADGDGFVEKNFVRVSLNYDGEVNFYTETSGDLRCITSYDMDLSLYASGADFRVWHDNRSEILHDWIPLPEIRPTVSEPIELPTITTADGVRYQLTITSETSGTIMIEGNFYIDGIGTTYFKSAGVVWKSGTQRPDVDSKNSGCNAGVPGFALPLLVFLPRVRRSSR